ncbi:MAG: hypothetical protein WDO71_03800 [Bacteroidota bacterium]
MPSCPVCQSTTTALWSVARDYEYFSTSKDYHYFQCADCYSIFIDPIPADELMTIYPSNYYSFVPGKKNIVVRIKECWTKDIFKRSLNRFRVMRSMCWMWVVVPDGWAGLIKNTDKRVVHTQVVDIDNKAKKIATDNGHAYLKGRWKILIRKKDITWYSC